MAGEVSSAGDSIRKGMTGSRCGLQRPQGQMQTLFSSQLRHVQLAGNVDRMSRRPRLPHRKQVIIIQ